MELKDFGYHQFDNFMEEHGIEISDESYLGVLLKKNLGNGGSEGSYSNILNISAAVESLVGIDRYESWLVENLKLLSYEPYKSNDKIIQINSKVAAELIAGGQLSNVFHEIEPLVERQGQKNPDFKLLGSTYLEVYCPQTSQQNIEAVQKQHNEQKDKMISISFSHPQTGQTVGAKRYPSNKIIDRVLSHKRSNDQTKVDSYNLLWLDLTHGFNASCDNTLPLVTIHHVGTIYTGSFGIWHAFYGKKHKSTFVPDRTELRYLNSNSGYYQQMEDGLFRERQHLNGALLLTKDGLIFFENPWAKMALPEEVKKKITQLYRFRANYSWFQASEKIMPSELVERELNKIEWLYQKSD